MYAIEYTVGDWEKGYKEVKKALLPLKSSTEAGRKAEAEAKLANSHGKNANIDVSDAFPVLT